MDNKRKVYRTGPWTESELDRTIANYRDYGLSYACDASPRSATSVWNKLTEIGVHDPGLSPQEMAWTPTEEAILRRLYPGLGAAELFRRDLLPGRSALAIKKHAALLGLAGKPRFALRSHPVGTPWAEDEERRMSRFITAERAGAPRDWVALKQAFPRRTESAIAAKLASMGKRPKTRLARRPWTPGEDDVVRRTYASAGAQTIANQLGRSVPAVTNRAYDLGVTRPQRQA